MSETTSSRSQPALLPRLLVVTLVVVLVLASYTLLRELAPILQPLLIAVFLGYLILPAQAWLVQRGLPRRLASITLVLFVVGALFALLGLVRRNLERAALALPSYHARFRALVARGIEYLPMEQDEFDAMLRELPIFQRDAASNFARTLRAAETFISAASGAFLVLIYFIFLLAEKATFAPRVRRALGDDTGSRLLAIIDAINRAISQYIAIKTAVSAMTGVASYLVLMAFGVDFPVMWGILIFLLNFIPYLGSLVATALPIALSFIQFDNPGIGVAVAACLIAIQQVIGMVVEPRLAGQKLGVSPVLILLALAFWGFGTVVLAFSPQGREGLLLFLFCQIGSAALASGVVSGYGPLW
ncbi:MAG: AI-2E family transporter, partial [Gemmataceae bacterium]|nr:AI-2E family transporter [Gemmataceae bacterium]